MSYYTPTPTIEPATHVELLRWRAAHQPNQRAYTFLKDGETQEVHITYKVLDRRARAIAAQLQQIGNPGDRVLLLYPQSIEYLVAFFGCLYAGMMAVPLYPPSSTQLKRSMLRLRSVIRDAQPIVALTTTAILDTVEAHVEQASDFQTIQWISTDTIELTFAERWDMPVVDSETIAFLQYTSGSTSDPKGVMVSHGNLLYNHQMLQAAFQHPDDSIYVTWLPLFHDMGLIGHALQAVYLGVPCILMTPLAFLQRPIRWLEAISRYRAHTSGGPNFAFELCISHTTPEQRQHLDLSCWQSAFNGAEPIRPATLARFAEAFGPCGFQPNFFNPCYGLAEATLIVSGGTKGAFPVLHPVNAIALEQNQIILDDATDVEARTLVSCGQSKLDERIMIVDPETATQCPPDRVGEIWVAGPHVAQGYWGRPEATQAAFQAYLHDTGDGPFLRTGDLGFMQQDSLVVTGRLKDLIIIDGRNHYPQDIELTAERSHSALRAGCSAAFSITVDGAEQLVVIAEIDRRYRPEQGATPASAEPGSAASPNGAAEQIVVAMKQAIMDEHEITPYAIVLLKTGSIAKTSSGKIQRSACRAHFLANTLSLWMPHL